MVVLKMPSKLNKLNELEVKYSLGKTSSTKEAKEISILKEKLPKSRIISVIVEHMEIKPEHIYSLALKAMVQRRSLKTN